MKVNYFSFKKHKEKYLITNELGYYHFLSTEDFNFFVHDQYENMSAGLISELKKKFFLYEEEDVFIERAIYPYRDNKSYLFSPTVLHIFVLTNACNMCCVYCQAQDSGSLKKGMMDQETAKKSVELALQSPSNYLSFEFQGGEPLLNFDMIRFIVEYTEEHCNDKKIDFSVVTNTLLLSDEMIAFFRVHKVSVSTSLDGDLRIHNYNRPQIVGGGTFEIVSGNIKKLHNSGVPVGAIQTTTKASLSSPKAIVDTYINLRLKSLFIRPLTPLGYAKEHWDTIGYTAEEFIYFYNEILDIILDYNMRGIHIVEGHAAIFLRKILSQYSDNYMELRSPCGASIGQMAYYYDGNIYTCDEGRMIAEMGIPEFRLGDVEAENYDELMESQVCKITCQASILESIPNCCDCVYHPYCGVCPVVNYALENNIYSREANNYKCKIYKGMLDAIFDRLDNTKIMEIFKSWI